MNQLTHRSILRTGASAYAQRKALCDDQGRSFTYAELDAVTDALAMGLIGYGLRPGDRVAWLSENCVEYLIAYFATAKANLVIAPLNYWLRPGELETLTDFVAPACVITSDTYVDVVESFTATAECKLRIKLGAPRAGWTSWTEALAEPGQLNRVPEIEGAPHEIIFTSGTTGQSKGVMRSQRKRILDSFAAALAFQVNRNDHMLFFGPQFHIGGASVPNQVLIQGGTASILTFDPERAARVITRGATYLIGVPAHYNLMFESGVLDAHDVSQVRGCYVGGSVANDRVFQDIAQHFPNADLVHGYGSTESGPHSLALRGREFLEHRGALGIPVPGTEVRVVDGDGDEVRGGEVGELMVRSGGVMDEYFRRPDLTKEAFTEDGWLHTGDLVRQDDDGYFFLAGRAKEMIITGGENVYPMEVEDALSAHPAVAEVAVVGVPDPVFEERVVAVVRTTTPVEADELRAFVRTELAGFKSPKEIHFVADFPRTPLGKIAKAELKRRYGSVFDDV